jgi:protein-S-isoprenylcysteine O-methyltransferase Ste14
MWAVARETPIFDYPLPAQGLIAAGCSVIGLGLAAAGVVSFRRARTTVSPWNPDRAAALVTTGIYARTRNPMYLGLLFLLLGWNFVLANALAGMVLPLFALFLHRFQVVPEERALAARFGEEYAAYRERVQRWV